jgi:hypothetical protein
LFRYHKKVKKTEKRKKSKKKKEKQIKSLPGPVREATRAGRIRSRIEQELGIPS